MYEATTLPRTPTSVTVPASSFSLCMDGVTQSDCNAHMTRTPLLVADRHGPPLKPHEVVNTHVHEIQTRVDLFFANSPLEQD